MLKCGYLGWYYGTVQAHVGKGIVLIEQMKIEEGLSMQCVYFCPVAAMARCIPHVYMHSAPCMLHDYMHYAPCIPHVQMQLGVHTL